MMNARVMKGLIVKIVMRGEGANIRALRDPTHEAEIQEAARHSPYERCRACVAPRQRSQEERAVPTLRADYAKGVSVDSFGAQRQVEEKVRTSRSAAEELHQAELPDDSPVLRWVVRCNDQICSRGAVPGEVARRLAGRPDHVEGAPLDIDEIRKGKGYEKALPTFGEKVTAMTVGKKRIAEYRFFEAICLASSSNMLIVGNRVASMRLAPAQRKDAEIFLGAGAMARDQGLEIFLGVVGVPTRRDRGPEEPQLRVFTQPVVDENACRAAQANANPFLHKPESRARMQRRMEEGRARN